MENTKTKNKTHSRRSLDRLVRPGDWILIAVQMPEELDDNETCHEGLFLEDFMQSRGSDWNVELRGVVRRSNMPSYATSHPTQDSAGETLK